MEDTEDNVVLSETSETELDDFELDLGGSFEEDLDSDEEKESPAVINAANEPRELGNSALLVIENSHPFHSCSFCSSIEIDSGRSSQWHIWAKLSVRPSEAPDECEFFQFCKEQYLNFPDSASLYMGIELKGGRPSLGCKVVFTFAPSQTVWIQKDYFTGRIHEKPADRCICTSMKLRQKPPAKAFERARLSMQECEQSHTRCPKRERTFVPLRLIRISSPTHILLYSPGPDEALTYAVLSYCWGGPQQCETRQANFAERSSSGMSVKDLSKTMREAIETCRDLGLKYLWADCLCIIQDNVTDKEEQIMQMPEIYAAAEVTIAASCARSTSDGFLEAKAPPEKLFRFSSAKLGDLFVLVRESIFDDFEPLDTRAWALQETILSIGVLNFTTTSVRFECGTSIVDLDTDKPPTNRPIPLLRQLGRALLKYSQNDFEGGDIWLRLVQEYSRRSLTFMDDRLLAISGLGDRFGPIIASNYLAGLWESQLPYGLLWRSEVPHMRPINERAPSWSWASINGPISYDLSSNAHWRSRIEGKMEVHSVSVVPLRMDAKYGSVRSGGLLCVTSLLKRARVTGDGTSRSLTDIKRQVVLKASLHFDTLSDEDLIMGGDVFAFNYYRTQSLLVRDGGNDLYTVGLILVQVSERTYRRVGLYNDAGRTGWFSNSSLETIYIV